MKTTFIWFTLLLTFTATAQYQTLITVAKDSSGDFRTIQEAINATKAFPDQPVTIRVKPGVYKEKVHVYSWNTNLSIVGEDRANTIITYDDYFGKIDLGRNSTFHTYTMLVEANDFRAENLTIINAAGQIGQAVALHVDADRAAFVNCDILGHQDTLYAAGEGFRQYFKNCYIEGTTDFIFGAATAVFEKCTIHSKSNSYITAASTPQNEPFGLVFLNCTLTADPGISRVYLGRPWRAYAKTVFINCELGDHIVAGGWHNWNDEERENTLYYAEYGSYGPGAKEDQRVSWSRILSDTQAEVYNLENIFTGWKPR